MSSKRKKESEVAQSCLSLCNPVDCSPPGASVHGIFQARILEWVAISFSRRSSRDRSGGLLFPSVEEFSTVCCDLHKGFSVVGEAEVDVFLEFPCFFDDPLHVGNLKYGFSKFRWTAVELFRSLIRILYLQEKNIQCFPHMFDHGILFLKNISCNTFHFVKCSSVSSCHVFWESIIWLPLLVFIISP